MSTRVSSYCLILEEVADQGDKGRWILTNFRIFQSCFKRKGDLGDFRHVLNMLI